MLKTFNDLQPLSKGTNITTWLKITSPFVQIIVEGWRFLRSVITLSSVHDLRSI